MLLILEVKEMNEIQHLTAAVDWILEICITTDFTSQFYQPYRAQMCASEVYFLIILSSNTSYLTPIWSQLVDYLPVYGCLCYYIWDNRNPSSTF